MNLQISIFLDLGIAVIVASHRLSNAVFNEVSNLGVGIGLTCIYAFIYIVATISTKFAWRYNMHCQYVLELAKVLIIWASNLSDSHFGYSVLTIQLIAINDQAKQIIFIQIFMLCTSCLSIFPLENLDSSMWIGVRILQLLVCAGYIYHKGKNQSEINITIPDSKSKNYLSAVQLDETSKEKETNYKVTINLEDSMYTYIHISSSWLKHEKYIIFDQSLTFKTATIDLSPIASLDQKNNNSYLTYLLLQQKVKLVKTSELNRFEKNNNNTIQDCLNFICQSESRKSIFLQCQLENSQFSDDLINIFTIYENPEVFLIVVHFQSLEGIIVKQNLLKDICHSVSHEFGTNLNCISMLAQTSYQNEELSNEVKQNIILPIIQSTEVLKIIVMNIRDYGYMQTQQLSLKLEEFDIVEEIDDILTLHKGSIEAKQIEILFDEDETPILTDKNRFRQIFYQLLSNSLRYTNEGSINIKIEQQNQKINVILEDSGVGMVFDLQNQNQIEKQRLESLLQEDRLIRVSENSIGCGLGLFISNQILKKLNEDQNCSIQFVTDQDFGSTFSFTLYNHMDLLSSDKFQVKTFPKFNYTVLQFSNPNFYFESNQPISHKSQSSSNMIMSLKNCLNLSSNMTFSSNSNSFKHTIGPIPNFQTKFYVSPNKPQNQQDCCSKVLLVDDEYFNLLALKAILKKFNLQSDQAFNGEQAIEKVVSRKERQCKTCGSSSYKIIFLDINMPIKDGFQTVRELKSMMLRKQISQGICVANTAFTDLQTKIKAIDEGMDYFLTKPINVSQITDIVMKILNKNDR